MWQRKNNRIIFHVDMDHFFAAIEERERPDIKGKPVVVGADPKDGSGRGVVSTSNYEARKYGVTSGIPIARAYRLCPTAVYLPITYSLYKRVSAQIMTILKGYAFKFEQWGLDEAFLDMTPKAKDFEEAKKIAKKIKQKIFEKENLTCSVGVGPNKLIAKVASDFEKPNGLTVVTAENAQEFLAPLGVRKLLCVGKKTEARLNAMGLQKIGDLTNYDPSVLAEKFGSGGTQLFLMAHGVDNSDFQENWERKSLSREITFEEDTSDYVLILETVVELAKDLHQELVASEFTFKTITVKIRYENFETHTRSKTLPFFTDRLKDIQKSTITLLQDYLQDERKTRLIGVRLSNLFSTENQTRLTDQQSNPPFNGTK